MRSLLYVPGDQPSMLAKSRHRGADAIVVDLEDAVALANKETARQATREFVNAPPSGSGTVLVRVNNTADLDIDLEAALSPNLGGIVLAKADDVDTVDRVDRTLAGFESESGLPTRTIGLVCLIESALGLRAAYQLACHPRTTHLALGEADLGADLGISHEADDAVWAPIRARVVVDSAAAAIAPPIGPVATNFRDIDALAASSVALAARGFGGRGAIHPAQVAPINDAFTPDASLVAKARDVIARYEQATARGAGVVVDSDGMMVDEAVIRHARRIVDLEDRSAD